MGMTTETTSPASRAEELRSALRHHSDRYYSGTPEIPDADYDELLRELAEIEAANPDLVHADSPTRTVGAAPDKAFAPVVHDPPMFSLHNAFGLQDLHAWQGRIAKRLDGAPQTFTVEPKFDGVAVSVRYENGQLVRAATRGDGKTGENVTHTARGIADLPDRLHGPDVPAVVEVRGEVYMSRSSFAALNTGQQAAGGRAYVNPRNAAAGALRLKDAAESANRGLSLWCYQIAVTEGPHIEFASRHETLRWMADVGLPVNDLAARCDSIEAVVDHIDAFESIRDELDYDCDGAVVKVDSLAAEAVLGEDSKAPRWAVAFKFAPEERTTKLIDIEVSIGPGGQATPWARLEPVFVGGVTVSAATLHNADQVALKGVRPGDTVIVRRAGEVIPEVVGAVLADRPADSQPWTFPTQCPECGSTLHRKAGAASTLCRNFDCPAQRRGRIEHFVSRHAMDVEHLGEKRVAQLVSEGLVRDAADLYYLDYVALAALEGFGEIGVRNLRRSLEDSKQRPIARLLFAVNIPDIGRGHSDRLAAALRSIDAIMAATPEEISQVDKFGEITAASVHRWFGDPDNLDLISRLRAAGVRMEDETPEEVDVPQTLAGMALVVSGTLDSYDRDGAKAVIVQHGGKAASSVSSRTTALVVGAKPGNSKVSKAEGLGVPVWGEDEFLSVLGGGARPAH